MADALKWTAQYRVTLDRSKRLQGDKITLPQSALEALLAAAPLVSVSERNVARQTTSFDPFNPYSFAAEQHAREILSDRQQQLPHPLTFRLVNSLNGRVVYAGIREFSAEEGEVGLSDFLLDALGVHGKNEPQAQSGASTPNGHVHNDQLANTDGAPLITVHAKELPKGTYVRLRPLEAGYDPDDWKSLLERYLRDNFTTLTNGEILNVPGAKHEHFRFLVDKFMPEEEGICIVDTDLEVDIEALNEEQARETLNQKLAKAKQAPGSARGSSSGGLVQVNQQYHGQVLPGEYVDYELKDWNRSHNLEIELKGSDEADVDLLISPFSARQRSKPRWDEHSFADLTSRPAKRLKLSSKNVIMEDAEKLYITVHVHPSWSSRTSDPQPYNLSVRALPDDGNQMDIVPQDEPGLDEVRCKNCQQIVPKRTLPLHEAFCYRNNVVCQKCGDVFLKTSQSWKDHWHCPLDAASGSGADARAKHDSIFHLQSPLQCSACDFQAFDLLILAQHRTTTCPGKEILCQFCHLVVPQQGPEDPAFTEPEVLLSGLTPHEVSDGARTTECHLCSKIVKLQNMKTHLKLHDRDRILRPKPRSCSNEICGRTIKVGREWQAEPEQLGLCEECFGPLHGTGYDPERKALRRRVERRLLQQIMAGCGKSWCHNTAWCRSGRRNSTGEDVVVPAKDALPKVKPVMERLSKGDHTGLRFCVDEAAQTRLAMADLIAAEDVYDIEWCIKALEEERNNLGRARDWLKDRAPRKDETLGPR